MKKKKMTADNVEQLLEVVKAIQRGEDPEKAIEAKRAESEQIADSPKPHQKESQKRKKAGPPPTFDETDTQKPDTEVQRGGQTDEDVWDDEFEKLLAEEEEKSLAESPAMERFSSGAKKFAGMIGAWKTAKRKTEKGAEAKEGQQKPEKSNEAKEEWQKPEKGSEAKEERQKPEKGSEAKEERQKPEKGTEAKEERQKPEKGSEAKEERRKPEKNAEAEEGQPKIKKLPAGNVIGDKLKELLGSLQQRGIQRKEMAMIGMGAVLFILIVVLIVNGIRSSLAEKRKKEHVTAEEGLTVTVEKEPKDWCSSYPVELKFRAKSGQITDVTINGVSYQADENGIVALEADDYLLEASVTAQEATLNARIEIPMMDSQPPVVNLSKEQSQITVAADDGRSQVAGIWYAAVHSGQYMQFPKYQEYKEPITFEADTTYYFYAQDKAGNRSVPIVTTMEAAKEFTLAQEKLALYPGDSGYLELVVEPEGALLNNLKYESANADVAVVDGSGKVTAAGEGSTVVKASADGLGEVSCQVEVSNVRTVTVSAIGDCTLGTDEAFNTATNLNAFDSMYGHAYFFRNVREILENDDVTFANMEGTLTTEAAREAKQYAFKGDPSYTEILKEGSVDVVTLANNHSSDYGAQSLEDTKQYLTEAEIDYCIGDTIAVKDVNGIKTAFIGIYVLDDGMGREAQVRETIAAAKAQGAQLVITAFHWGSEKATQPDETQQALAHIAVDCGADLVVGHHPHVLQGIEKYNGKYIVYSLGNFCFGGNSAPSDVDTMIFRQTFTVSKESVLADGQIEIIPCKVSSADGYNNYQPTPAEGAEADRILGRINEYSQAYGQTYTASSGLD